MLDLPRDMEEEVLCRIPMTSLRPVRSTCKRWNTLSRCELFAKKHLGHQVKEDPLVVMMMDYRVGLMRLNLSTTNDIVKPEAKLTGLDQIDVCEIFHSDGLLLCIPKYHSRLLVWNTYWGRQQPRWIDHTHNHHEVDKHLYGHLDKYMYVLRFIDYPQKFVEFKIYDFNSDSWRIILDLLPPRDWRIRFDERGLVVLFQRCDTLTMEIWISTTIEQPNAVSWNPKVFLSANIKQLVHPLWQFWPFACFFIDEEKKVAVVFDKNNHMG
uniref:F-box domain-containing protein n=1 Tax=Brassica oleracea TaxID=3712 RepID=A0A3P6EFA4_BRAOL|nr:unnamed protein product [Brassica oleracea]